LYRLFLWSFLAILWNYLCSFKLLLVLNCKAKPIIFRCMFYKAFSAKHRHSLQFIHFQLFLFKLWLTLAIFYFKPLILLKLARMNHPPLLENHRENPSTFSWYHYHSYRAYFFVGWCDGLCMDFNWKENDLFSEMETQFYCHQTLFRLIQNHIPNAHPCWNIF